MKKKNINHSRTAAVSHAYINNFEFAVRDFESLAEEERQRKNNAIRSRFSNWI